MAAPRPARCHSCSTTLYCFYQRAPVDLYIYMFGSALFLQREQRRPRQGPGHEQTLVCLAGTYLRATWRLSCPARDPPCSRRVDVILSPRISSCSVVHLTRDARIVSRGGYVDSARRQRSFLRGGLVPFASLANRPRRILYSYIEPRRATSAGQLRNYCTLYTFVRRTYLSLH